MPAIRALQDAIPNPKFLQHINLTYGRKSHTKYTRLRSRAQLIELYTSQKVQWTNSESFRKIMPMQF